MAELKKASGFNPVKEDKENRAQRVVWTTANIEIAAQAIQQGKKLVANPFYENNIRLLKPDLVYQRTAEEIEEWKKCANDVMYFAEKYCKIMTPEGIKNVTLRPYQREYLKHLASNRMSIYLACRQCGKTITTSLFLLHYICFNYDKNALIAANKFRTAADILEKAKQIFLEIPYFLKPGIYKWNESSIVTDGNTVVKAETTTINTGIGTTIHLLMLDEFAHIPSNIMEKFYNNIFPTITAAKAQCFISSTQNGLNLFSRLYTAAAAGENDYAAFKTDWWEVPEWNEDKKCWEKRDEAWYKRQIANLGSLEAFEMQFGTNFNISANTLIAQKVLTQKRQHVIAFQPKDLLGVPHSQYWTWKADFEPMEDLRKNYMIFTIDLAEGGGGDYTVAIAHRMIEPGSKKTEVVGMFRSNVVDRDSFALSLQILQSNFCDPNRLLTSYEANVYGDMFLNTMLQNMDKQESLIQNWDPSTLVKFYNESGTKYKHGIKITPGNKTTNCLIFKEHFERGHVINDENTFHTELSNFIDDGNQRFAAAFGHDDTVMATMQIEFVKPTLQYKIMRDEFDEGNAPVSEMIFNPFESELGNIGIPYEFMERVLSGNEARLRRF